MFKTMKRLLHWAGPYRKRLWLGCNCSFLSGPASAIPTMVAAWALGQVILAGWQGDTFPAALIGQSLALIAGGIVLRFLLGYGRAVLQESIGTEIAAEERIRMGEVLKRVPLGYFSKNSTGDILTGVTTELSALEINGMKMVDAVINGYGKFLFLVLCLIAFSPLAAIVALIGAGLSALALHGISRRSEKKAVATYQATEDLASAAIETIRGLQIVKSFGKDGMSVSGFRRASRRLRDIRINIEMGFTPYNCLHLLALKLASVAIVLVAAEQTLTGTMSLSVFLMFVLFSFILFESVEGINEASHTLGVIDGAMAKLEALEQATIIDADGSDLTPPNHTIVLNNVCFAYEPGHTVLHDVNALIPEGSTTAIVGPSGSGKSTLVGLIARFYDVTDGSISLGGMDLRRFTCDSLLRNISMVFQNVYLFRDTIAANIRFGRPGATEEEVVAAAKAARCHDFIMALPDGYDTVIGEGGSTLSGGEKQRISIARAILKDAPIIILDEATASIDPENEHLIQEALSALTARPFPSGKGAHRKTVITIAHRLATIEEADQILVVDDGTIVQKGTHAELLAQPGTYQKFVAIRKQAEGWRL